MATIWTPGSSAKQALLEFQDEVSAQAREEAGRILLSAINLEGQILCMSLERELKRQWNKAKRARKKKTGAFDLPLGNGNP